MGDTAKFAALAEVPILVPPVETVYHLIVFPAEVPLRFVEPPLHIIDGVADTEVGMPGIGFTVTVVLLL